MVLRLAGRFVEAAAAAERGAAAMQLSVQQAETDDVFVEGQPNLRALGHGWLQRRTLEPTGPVRPGSAAGPAGEAWRGTAASALSHQLWRAGGLTESFETSRSFRAVDGSPGR